MTSIKPLFDRFCPSHRLHIKSLWMNLILAFYFTSVLNMGLWHYLYSRLDPDWGINAFILGITVPLFLFLLFFLIFSVVMVPWFGKIFIIPILLLSSVANYAMAYLGITIDANMIQNVIETSTRETMELVTFMAVAWIAVTGIIPAYLLGITHIDYHPRKQEIKQRLIFFIGALVFAVGTCWAGVKQYYFFRHDNRAISSLENPFNIFRAIHRNMRNHEVMDQTFVRLDPNAKRVGHMGSKPSVFIIMVGETARWDHWSLNGYSKDTNSDLEKENVISFKKVYSCATSTSISVPCMFSNKGRKEFSTKEAPYTENLLDILKQTGYDVIWLENDEGSKGVAARIKEERLDLSKNKRYCTNGSCFDEILIDGLEERLANIKQDTVIVMHTMGSHGPAYYLRYPDAQRKFKPTCDSSDVHGCDPEGLYNSYDNTIYYTNYVIARTIDILKKFPQMNPGLLYLSDHGESLGEDGIYLHAYNYSIAPEGQKHVPFILWMSDGMQKEGHYSYSCLAKKAEIGEFSHDNLYHTVLAMMGVESKTYDRSLDMFDSCRN